MKCKAFLAAVAAVLLTAAPLFAQSVVDQIRAQLVAQGYDSISVSRTLLGRTRIEASSARFEREIIVDPRTGEILRDYWEIKDGSDADAVEISNPGSGTSGSGISGSGSGSGSGHGSGSGSGGSGHGSGDDDDDD